MTDYRIPDDLLPESFVKLRTWRESGEGEELFNQIRNAYREALAAYPDAREVFFGTLVTPAHEEGGFDIPEKTRRLYAIRNWGVETEPTVGTTNGEVANLVMFVWISHFVPAPLLVESRYEYTKEQWLKKHPEFRDGST